MPQTFRILSIDGGGIRGIIPAVFLREIEKRTGRPIAQLFDLIAGTSTGGFLTLMLTKPAPGGAPAYSATDLVQLYIQVGKDIFHRTLEYEMLSGDGWLRPKYPGENVIQTLAAYLDKFERTEIKDALAHVLLTSYEIEQRRPVLFTKRAAANPDHNFFMSDVARATAAAPTVFPAVEIQSLNGARRYHLIDGGLVANNPSACALAEALSMQGPDGEYLMVSLGTGEYEAPIPYDKAVHWGLTGWAPHILDVLFDGVAQGVDIQMNEVLSGANGGRRYYRFQVRVPEANDSMDDANPDNIEKLQELASELIDQKTALFDELAKRLMEGRGFQLQQASGG